MRTPRRLRRIVPAVLTVVVLGTSLGLASTSSVAGPVTRLVPNVVAEPAFALRVGTVDGEKALRFSVATPNLGVGPLAMKPRKDDCDGDGDLENDRTALQLLYHDANANGTFERGTDRVGEKLEAGCFLWHDAPGHNHWHFQNYARYQLRKIKAGVTKRIVASRTKVGFCMLDSGIRDGTLPGAPAQRYYQESRCHEDKPQGISIGWYDVYTYNLPDQDIVIAGLPDGRYCLRVRLDPGDPSFPAPVGRIVEGSDTDNRASTKLRLQGSDVSELAGTC